MGVEQLAYFIATRRPDRESNPHPLDRKPDALLLRYQSTGLHDPRHSLAVYRHWVILPAD